MPTTVQPFHRMWIRPLCNFRTPSISDSHACSHQQQRDCHRDVVVSEERARSLRHGFPESGSRSTSASRTKRPRSPCRPRVSSVSVARPVNSTWRLPASKPSSTVTRPTTSAEASHSKSRRWDPLETSSSSDSSDSSPEPPRPRRPMPTISPPRRSPIRFPLPEPEPAVAASAEVSTVAAGEGASSVAGPSRPPMRIYVSGNDVELNQRDVATQTMPSCSDSD